MKKTLTLVITVAVWIGTLSLSSGCKKNNGPTGCISASTDTTSLNQIVNFTNCTTGAIAYLWNFGDGNTSNEFSPSHVYTSGGTYTVTMTPTGPSGAGTPGSIKIVVRSGGTWSFQGTNHSPFLCVADRTRNYIIADDSTSSVQAALVIYFNGPLPTSNATFNVANYYSQSANPNDVVIAISKFSQNNIEEYVSSGIGNSTISLSVSGGKISVSGSNIDMGTPAQNNTVNPDHLPLNIRLAEYP